MSGLVLSRRVNEEILIGDNIRIMLIEIRGDKARIRIDAPRGVSVNRKEVADAIAAEKRQIDSQAEPGIGEDFG